MTDFNFSKSFAKTLKEYEKSSEATKADYERSVEWKKAKDKEQN